MLSVEVSSQTDSLVQLISALRQAEINRDYQQTISLFAPYWKIDNSPEFSQFSLAPRAELLQLAGEFLINYGKAKNRIEFQERGKNALEKAIRCYEKINSLENVFECQMLIAVGYYNEGHLFEYQAFLETAESYFVKNKIHPTYLKIQTNYAIFEMKCGAWHKSRQRIDRIGEFIARCNDLKTNVLYYNQAGLIYRLLNQTSESIEYFNRAFSFAESLASLHFQALILNGLANTYRVRREFGQALLKAEEALNLIPASTGWAAHFLDTIAHIHFDNEDEDTALDYVQRAIEIFERGEDASGYSESLWLLIRIYLKMGLNELSLLTFVKLYQVTTNALGEDAAKTYARKYLDKMLPNPENGNYYEKINSYKRSLIENALVQTDGKIKSSAALLGIEHQTLSRIIKTNFPELRSDFNLKRKSRSDRHFK